MSQEARRRAQARARRRERRQVPRGRAHIVSSFNNTIITITDPSGNVLCWSSAGASGFKGSRKKHTICSTSSRGKCSQEGHGVWNATS